MWLRNCKHTLARGWGRIRPSGLKNRGEFYFLLSGCVVLFLTYQLNNPFKSSQKKKTENFFLEIGTDGGQQKILIPPCQAMIIKALARNATDTSFIPTNSYFARSNSFSFTNLFLIVY